MRTPNHRLLLFLLLSAAHAGAAEFVVDDAIDRVDLLPGDGLCANALGHCSLRAAIQETNALPGADSIVLGAEVYVLSLPGSQEDAAASGDLDILDDLVLIGAGAAASIIDGGALDRVFDLGAAATVRIEALTLRNGLLDPDSGPMATAKGAGMRVGAGVTVELQDVEVRGNRVEFLGGGAAGIDNAGCLHGVRVRLIDNGDFAEPGFVRNHTGGIFSAGADSCLVLEDSEITGNRGSVGSALTVDEAAPAILRRTLVADNFATSSNALHLNHGSEVRLENVTISGNASGMATILNDGFTLLTIVNSTITANQGPGDGRTPLVGGILDVHGLSRTFLTNTILSGNAAGIINDNCDNVASLDGGNLIGLTSQNGQECRALTRPDDFIDIDPGLGPLADNGGFTRSHRPGPNAIDRGVAGGCLPEDQRGLARPQDGDGDGLAICDIGAIETEAMSAGRVFDDGFENEAHITIALAQSAELMESGRFRLAFPAFAFFRDLP